MTETEATQSTQRLERPIANRMLGGASVAIARRMSVPTGVVRVGFLITALFGGLGVILYAAAWGILPSEGVSESPVQRWVNDLSTPGRRSPAIFLGIGVSLVALAAIPVGPPAAVLLLLVGLVLMFSDRKEVE